MAHRNTPCPSCVIGFPTWNLSARPQFRALPGTFEEQRPFAHIRGHRRGSLKLGAGFCKSIELLEQIATHARQKMIIFKRSFRLQSINQFKTGRLLPRPSTQLRRDSIPPPEMAQLRPMFHKACTICGQSVSSGVRARAWQAAIAACNSYQPALAAPSYPSAMFPTVRARRVPAGSAS